MTPSSPDEALHFRGKTLTPESPRPLHIAEPANIPVLQHQMDPVFNDTSTYDTVESGQEPSNNDRHAPGLSAENIGSEDVREKSGPVKGLEEPGSLHSGPSQVDGSMNMNDTSISASAKTSVPSSRSFPGATEPSVAGEPENPSLTAVDADSAPSLGQAFANDPSHTSQALPGASQVDNAVANWPSQSTPHDRLDTQHRGDKASNSHEDGVDFQNLLDNLPPPSLTAPSAPPVSEATASSMDYSSVPQAASDEPVQASLSLPPRPPPQEKPSIHPNYNPSDDIRSYHQLPPHNPTTSTSYPNQDSNHLPSLVAAGAPGTSSGSNALPPPPLASFQQSPPSATESQEHIAQASHRNGGIDRQTGRPIKATDEDTPWSREVQRKYDEFLHEERVYVTEGLWDRFPPGSRLFVGNLPTERVTKRDLFHIFHKYGKLAQISIKQAYGFIQFLESSSCHRSLQAEQGAVIRGRKIREFTLILKFLNHREIQDQGHRHRNHPAPCRQGDQGHQNLEEAVPTVAAFVLRADCRLVTSGMNQTTGGEMTIDLDLRLHGLSVEGMGIGRGTGHQRGMTVANGDALGLLLEGIEDTEAQARGLVARTRTKRIYQYLDESQETFRRNFIFHVENSFRNRGLRVDVLVLGPRIPLNAAVQRQIVEGVLAVVRLSRPNQFSRKIPLQVFDRTAGPDKVRFNEYPEIDPNVAAEIVCHAQPMQQRSGAPAPFPPNPAFGVPPLPPPPPHIPHGPLPGVPHPQPPNVANLISSLDGPALQSLLSTLQQRQQPVPPAQQPFPAANPAPGVADLASILSNATRQPIPGNPQHPLPPHPLGVQPSTPGVVPDPNLMSLLAKGLGGQPPQGQGNLGPHVQNIVNQLSKWKQ
ncbi:rna-binding protein [Aspergillus sclerotialis]|uniref:Rna-binding protein n=1 Tax=Aspergillus sclerotialis TaxID=2070753 RepID=A0A3A2ZB28_9EURO|nr:rna-binding protein [Aspergillus sclerotialis]